jgi:hypothetical protein
MEALLNRLAMRYYLQILESRRKATGNEGERQHLSARCVISLRFISRFNALRGRRNMSAESNRSMSVPSPRDV